MRKVLMLFLVFLVAVNYSFAQTKMITGKITDEQGNPVPYSTVAVKGAKTGTQSKEDGTFTLTVPANTKALVISSVGKTETEISVGSSTVINVTLKNSSNSLNEVVVTALGVARDKRSLGYATQNLKGDELANRGEANVVNSLQGKVAGVSIIGASGSPGAS
ncbi:MAG TPA: carboxypeptidase-like regulatory domain-containing protein, partial [Flavitalea sp.]|nr:carboxypeptidase-like regulatory domain-containing protein [Flavitalea sp.]